MIYRRGSNQITKKLENETAKHQLGPSNYSTGTHQNSLGQKGSDYNQNVNLTEIQENELSKKNETHLNDDIDNHINEREQLSDKYKIKIKSNLPKTAINFYNMKKGLFRKAF